MNKGVKFLLSLILGFNLLMLFLLTSVHCTLFNPGFWSYIVMTGPMRDELRDAVDDMDWSYIDAKYEVSRDETDEFFEDNIEGTLKKRDYSASDIKREKKNFNDAVNDMLEDYREQKGQGDFFTAIDMGTSLTTTFIMITAATVTVFALLILFLEKNKFRAVSSLVKDVNIASCIAALLWGGVYILMGQSIKSTSNHSDLVILKAMRNGFGMVALIFAGIFIAGIILRVFLKKAADTQDNVTDDEESDDGYDEDRVSDYRSPYEDDDL